MKAIMAGIFGEDNVASLSTYGTFQIKGLMKDLSRAFDLDHNEVNKLNKKIEQELKALYSNQGDVVKDKSMVTVALEDVERVSPTFREFCERYPEPAKHFKALYGRVRHIGRHASAVIIGDDLQRETAIFKQRDRETGGLVTQTSFTEGIVNKNISAMGFVKFDMLGLATLRVIHHAIRLIAAKEGVAEAVVLERLTGDRLDLDDQRVLKHIFWEGNFAGIFQFSQRGIRKVAKGIKPDCFEDIVAIAALYRPGPLAAKVDKLYKDAKRKALAGELTYEHPVLEKILKRTHGCLIYQEQLMSVARDLGKMAFKDVQRIRKNLLKKNKSVTDEFLLAEQTELKGKFMKGVVENGLSEERAQHWWQSILYFGGYGFNSLGHKTTHIPTYHKDGSLKSVKPIEEMEEGDLVLTRDEINGKMELTKVMALYDHDEQEVVEVTLDDGSKVTCTMDHKFRVTTGEMLPLKLIIAQDLEIVASSAVEDTASPTK